MTYCEIKGSQCVRFPEGDTGHCDDCSESLIVVHDGVAERGLQLSDVQIIASSVRHEIGAYEKSTGLSVKVVTEGRISR